jgi:hypothetical protein
MIFNVEEMLAPGSGVLRLEKKVEALEARIAELEKKIAEAPFPVTFLACPRCGHHMQHKPTGVVIDTLPPMTQIACVGCGLIRSIE